MKNHLVECVRVTRDTGTITVSEAEIDAELPNDAIKKFISDYLPPIGFPQVYVSEFSRPPEYKKTPHHFVSYQAEGLDFNQVYYLSCRYSLDETPIERKPRRPVVNRPALAARNKRDEKIRQVLEAYDQQKQLAALKKEP